MTIGWIVLDNGLPVRYYEKGQGYDQGQFCSLFDTYDQAYAVRQVVKGDYLSKASAAPSIDSFQFQSNNRAAQLVKVVRVEE